MDTEILYIGRHEQIMETVLRLINQESHWKGCGALTDSEAKDLFCGRAIDIVLLGSGIEESSEAELRSFFCGRNPDIIIIQHYGGGSGLLNGEIWQALENRKK